MSEYDSVEKAERRLEIGNWKLEIRNHRIQRETEGGGGSNSGFIGSFRGYPRSNPNPNPNPNRSDVAVAPV